MSSREEILARVRKNQPAPQPMPSLPSFDRNSMFLAEMKEFLNCASRRAPTSIPIAEGIAVLEIATEAKQNAREGLTRDRSFA